MKCALPSCPRSATVSSSYCATHKPKPVLPVQDTPRTITTGRMAYEGYVLPSTALEPFRSARHLAIVRAMPCAWCGMGHAEQPSDPHHFGPHGMGTKTSDFRTVPLCRVDHDRFHDTGRLGNMTREQTAAWFNEVIIRVLIARLAEIEAKP